MERFSQACKDFGLTISLKKTNVLGQGTETPSTITIDDYELDVVHHFNYLGPTVTDNLSLDVELENRIRKAAATLARLNTRVWSNPMLTEKTKMAVYTLFKIRVSSVLTLSGCLFAEHFNPTRVKRRIRRSCCFSFC